MFVLILEFYSTLVAGTTKDKSRLPHQTEKLNAKFLKLHHMMLHTAHIGSMYTTYTEHTREYTFLTVELHLAGPSGRAI
jgi:hypothetical protein